MFSGWEVLFRRMIAFWRKSTYIENKCLIRNRLSTRSLAWIRLNFYSQPSNTAAVAIWEYGSPHIFSQNATSNKSKESYTLCLLDLSDETPIYSYWRFISPDSDVNFIKKSWSHAGFFWSENDDYLWSSRFWKKSFDISALLYEAPGVKLVADLPRVLNGENKGFMYIAITILIPWKLNLLYWIFIWWNYKLDFISKVDRGLGFLVQEMIFVYTQFKNFENK